MAAEILLVGVNYKRAGLHIRERLVFHAEAVPAALAELSQKENLRELVLLSTCNRTEIYTVTADPCAAEAAFREFFSRRVNLDRCELSDILYVLKGQTAARHLMEVACGLDSLVPGENEIQGQVREALTQAQSAGKSGPILSALFRSAITAGKRARTETEIGDISHSLAATVVHLAKEMFGPLETRTALLVGAGKISSSTARALKSAGLKWILLANRTYERAQKLAIALNGSAVHFDKLEEHLQRADIVICSTGAPHTILHREAVLRALSARPERLLLIVDLAVPRDVDPEIRSLSGARLVDIDGLETLAEKYQPLTACSRQAAGRLIDEELERFEKWLVARRQAPVIQALRKKADEIAARQVELTLRRMGEITPEQRRSVEAMGQAIVSQLLHDPIRNLKEPPEDLELGEYIELVESMFGLS